MRKMRNNTYKDVERNKIADDLFDMYIKDLEDIIKETAYINWSWIDEDSNDA